MQVKSKNGLKVVIIAVALLLCLALAIGITGAFYQAKRQATGTLSMDQGIIIDYNGFDKTAAEDWATWTRGVTLPLFKTNDAQPGEQIAVNAAGIRANAESVNFYARVKLSYKFYNGETPVEFAESTKLIKTSSSFFGTNWVESGDGYYYYATGSTLNKFEKGAAATTPFVDLFATDAKFVIEGEGFKGSNDLEGGGFKINDTTSINKIEVYLTLETLQGDVQTDELNTMGWKITASSDDPTEDIEDFSKNKLLDSNGDEIDSNSTDLIEDTVYQVVDESGNGYKFTYKLDETNMTATITGPAGSPKQLDIPSKIRVNKKDYTIIGIGENAFNNNCYVLKSVTLPNTVTVIGDSAFRYCNSLTSISIPDGVTNFGDYVFDSDYNLQPSITENNIAYLGNETNKYVVAWKAADTTQTNYIINDNCKTIYHSCFRYCDSLTNIVIPNNVINIGESAFEGCSSLVSVNMGNNINNIGRYAFESCGNLQPTIVENGVAYLGNETNKYAIAWRATDKTQTSYSIKEDCRVVYYQCFVDCNKAKQIIIPNSIISIGDYAFQNCKALTSIILPNILSIGNWVLGNSGLISITIPNSVTEIGERAFANCTGLTSITIPDNVSVIRGYAFQGCSGLSTVTIGEGWVKASDNTAVAADTLLKDIDYDIKRA